MKTATLLIGCLIVACVLSSIATAQFLSPTPTIQGMLHQDTTVLFSGKTSITSTFTGYPMNALLNASLVEGMNAFTLAGANSIPTLSTVIVAEDIDITQVQNLEDLYVRYEDHITEYTNVEITTDTGLFLLGYPIGGTIIVQSEAAYAISSSLSLTVEQGTTIPFFVMATQTPMTLDFSGEYAVLAQPYTNASMRIVDQHGKNLWSGHSPNNYLIIQDQHFQITQQPPLYLFPLNPKNTTAQPLSVLVTPAVPTTVNISKLLKSISAQTARFPTVNISEAPDKLQKFDTILSAASLIANGAMILAKTNDTLTIDRTPQTFKRVGFTRFHDLKITYAQSNSGPAIQGTVYLVFLGDHFYNQQAKNTTNGIAFPYGLLIVWIIALSIFIYIRFFLRPSVDQHRDKTVKWYALGVHLALLIVGFILLDREVSYLFGISAFDALAVQGMSMITGLFLGLELLMWVLGYVLLALPVRLITTSGLRLLHIGKGGRGIGAGIGDFSIWIFTVFYLPLFINIILSTLNISNLFAMG